jgi:hypothetical protein
MPERGEGAKPLYLMEDGEMTVGVSFKSEILINFHRTIKYFSPSFVYISKGG